MKTIKFARVLIAISYDSTAQIVAEAGFSFAKTLGAEVILMHVLFDPLSYSTKKHIRIMGFVGHKETDQWELDSVVGLKKVTQLFLETIKLHLGDNTIQSLVTEGDRAESILLTAKDLHADIIVMGSRSQKGLENTATTNLTEEVLHDTSIPIFIIPI